MASGSDVVRRQAEVRGDRFALSGTAPTMKAVVTTGNGGLGHARLP